MKSLPTWSSASLILLTIAGVLALSQSAYADGDENPRALTSFLASPALETLDLEAPLPTSLDAWEEADEYDLREAHLISIDFLPQGRLSQKPPFIDFSRFEMGAYIGAVKYSSKFRADPNVIGGITARVPLPGIPGDWGVWSHLILSYVSRDLPFYYKDQAAAWFGLKIGADYTFLRSPTWYLRANAGILYAHWNGVNGLDNGMGILLGPEFGFYWIRGNNKATLNIAPELSYDGEAYMFFMRLGFSVDF